MTPAPALEMLPKHLVRAARRAEPPAVERSLGSVFFDQ